MSRVRLSNVSKRFGESVALHPTELEVQEGEFLTLLDHPAAARQPRFA
jgi:ABC-type sugar transport system ATPase subunit